MSLYISVGNGTGARHQVWTPGDQGSPNAADTKEELVAFCPQPAPSPCYRAECGNLRYISARGPGRRHPHWYWSKRACMRCENLRQHHGLDLVDLIAMWEAQSHRCYRYPDCTNALTDPRITVTRGQGQIVIDHDHQICPQVFHSCDRCRRGLACNTCNSHKTAVRTAGLWVLPPKADDLIGWLEFIGPEGRDRLRAGLTMFPEQPVRRAPRRQPRGEGNVIPLFDVS